MEPSRRIIVSNPANDISLRLTTTKSGLSEDSQVQIDAATDAKQLPDLFKCPVESIS